MHRICAHANWLPHSRQLSLFLSLPSTSLSHTQTQTIKDTNSPRREANPDLKVTEVTTAAGSAWKEMTEEQKAPYVEQAAKAKEVLCRSPSIPKSLFHIRPNKLEIVIESFALLSLRRLTLLSTG
jgi:hypothetical protein